MAWTAGKQRLARVLWASGWTDHAIGVALDVAPAAVASLARRRLRLKNAKWEEAALTRALVLAAGPPVGVETGRRMLEIPGFVEGMRRAG